MTERASDDHQASHELAEPKNDGPSDPELAIDPGRPAGGAAHKSGERGLGLLLVTIAVFGALGSLARDAIGHALAGAPASYPWGTFAVNLAGAAGIGVAVVVLAEAFPASLLARPAVVTGFLGGFTTFSTFVVDADLLVRDGRAPMAVAYVVASTVFGLAAVVIGMAGGRVVSLRLFGRRTTLAKRTGASHASLDGGAKP
ncbi:MAG: CrcB-like protein [Acidimicrobiaceae bacterium]|nr:CrcB-like protein [Acidimicrobiaceae bacterium]